MRISVLNFIKKLHVFGGLWGLYFVLRVIIAGDHYNGDQFEKVILPICFTLYSVSGVVLLMYRTQVTPKENLDVILLTLGLVLVYEILLLC
jgi:hypothetical protein